MNEIGRCTQALTEAVRNSSEYKRYQRIRAEVLEHPDVAKRLHEFRMKNYLIQNSQDNIDLYTETDKLEKEYKEFCKDPIVEEYLEAENAFCKIIRQINWDLIENLDVELVLVDD